jgi:hypothetical protein
MLDRLASHGTSGAHRLLSAVPPWTSTNGGPAPYRLKPIRVPSAEVAWLSRVIGCTAVAG